MSQFLTDTHDLRELVSNCRACSNSVLHGQNILHHEHLVNLQLQHCKKLCAFIINTKLPSESYGHWICLLRFRNVFVMIDGLNYAIKRPDIMRNVKRFCHLNNCILNVMHLRCQEKSSFKCGYIALAVIAKYHTMSVKQFYNLQTVFKRNSIKFNENLLLEFAQKHFAFSLQMDIEMAPAPVEVPIRMREERHLTRNPNMPVCSRDSRGSCIIASFMTVFFIAITLAVYKTSLISTTFFTPVSHFYLFQLFFTHSLSVCPTNISTMFFTGQHNLVNQRQL